MFECYGQEAERCCLALLAAAESSGASVEAKDARGGESTTNFLAPVSKVTQAGTVQSKISVDGIDVDAPADPARSGRAVPQRQRHLSFAAERQMSRLSLPLPQ